MLILIFITGCSGYRYTQQDNPLSQYGIVSLSVPMFHNYSNQSEVSNNFTRETYRLLSSYRGLKLRSGYHQDSDAIMIGIIKSPEKIYDTLTPNNFRVAQDKAGKVIGDKRQDFYIPGTSDINLLLQIIVIKKPTEEELTLLKSGLGDKVKLTSRIIFNETLPLRTQYTREIFDEEPVSITATQNAGIQRKVIRSLSEQAALSVRDMILYAF
ncbi:MAG: hypothetical protein H0V66_07515 [Bdellovibrionales bacterium]|nr:hypothetical protein [Bdellovibrionales bacterium]